jgi:hypothetical protein
MKYAEPNTYNKARNQHKGSKEFIRGSTTRVDELGLLVLATPDICNHKRK